MRVLAVLACSLAACAAVPAGDGKESRKLPAASVVTSWGQLDGPKDIDAVLKDEGDAAKKAYQLLAAAARRRGATDLFMVEAKDFAGAVGLSADAFCRGVPGEGGRKPFAWRPNRDGVYWVFAYLGRGPAQSRGVASVEVGKGHVRVSFDTHRVDTEDDHAHLAWVELGALDPGKYALELYDTKHKEVALSRTVHVEKAK